jgi:hypothetical protein
MASKGEKSEIFPPWNLPWLKLLIFEIGANPLLVICIVIAR